MRTEVFTLYDGKLGAHMQPFFSGSAGTAIRSVIATASEPNTVFARFPADFTLFHVATFDDQNGKFEAKVPAVSLGTVLELMPKKPQQVEMFEPDPQHPAVRLARGNGSVKEAENVRS